MAESLQKFMIKLPGKLHRELMAYAGVKGGALSDILVGWIEATWNQQAERTAIVEMIEKLSEQSTPQKAAPVEAGSVTQSPPKKAPRAKKARN